MLLVALWGCKGSARNDGGMAPSPSPAPAVPELLPSAFPYADYVGAAACEECHRAEYDAWSRSPHGRSMAPVSAGAVLGDFSAGPLHVADGTISFSGGPDGYFMEIQSNAGREKRKVDFVFASGRQHQLYAVRGGHGTSNLLPAVWSTKTKEWLPLSLYQPTSLSPDARDYWGSRDMTIGCASCHVSQAHRRDHDGVVESVTVDLSVNCESCHGPGREHVRMRRSPPSQDAGDRQADTYRDLRKLSSLDESRVCGQCHGFQLKRYVFPPAADGLPQIFVTSLINDALRPDATQHLTSYQYPGHVLTAGFARNILRCNDCHAPHGLEARDKAGASAAGDASNKQCTTQCHDKLVTPSQVTQHSNHSPKIRCVDCHMAYSWIGDDDSRRQRTSDHSITMPHPRETIDVGTPNACNTCHKDKTPAWSLAALARWGKKDSLGTREWVQTIAMGRKSAPGATERLVALLTKSSTGTYLKASALDLLAFQPRDPSVVPAVTPFASDPDPALRASALRALYTHDVEGRAHWRELGLSDDHPFVRMETFSMIKEVDTLAPADIERDLADVLAYMSPPTDGIIHLITVRHRRHELEQALALLDLFQRVTLPNEQRALNVDLVRSRIQSDIAGAKAKAR